MSSLEMPASSIATSPLDATATIRKYTEEAQKRVALRQGVSIYSDLLITVSERFRSLAEDPWVDHDALNALVPPLKDGDKAKVIILGGGFSALLAAVRLIQQGFDVDDIRLVDSAGYVPKKRYSPGYEILEHMNRIAVHWNLIDKALFRTKVTDLVWNEDSKEWTVSLTEDRGPGQDARDIKVKAQYFILASGLLSRPQIPNIPGLESFGGDMFHTARWNWTVTGGTPIDSDMTMLKDKRVGIIGTGGTAIQTVPNLARHAEELIVFQRTPSAVSPREQQDPDPVEWKSKMATHKGWQADRMVHLARWMTRVASPDEPSLVDDWWTRIDSFHAVLGSSRKGRVPPTPEAISAHIAEFVALDLPYGERTRAWVDEIVKDKDTATKLKAWYPSRCKRPTFSDEYLQAFNPAEPVMPKIHELGRNGATLEDKWEKQGPATMHGIMSHSFPKLFWFGGLHTGSASNHTHMVDVQARHMAYVLGEAKRRGTAVVEATVEGEEGWSTECALRAAWYTMVPMCTPGYFNKEGAMFGKQPAPEDAMRMARASSWGEGMLSYEDILTEWRRKGDLTGMVIG
ncbi:Pentalenolactone D synthase [Cytospora mali]|uniref:Pentalenolactone D synthase n=1 Tax=Cytospora mali TaxID=578113 RepID=A0A194V088_CYTMA|nr:Pentalenolactone D synthase [Valsa mali var. pyri (nom. inval.)]